MLDSNLEGFSCQTAWINCEFGVDFRDDSNVLAKYIISQFMIISYPVTSAHFAVHDNFISGRSPVDIIVTQPKLNIFAVPHE